MDCLRMQIHGPGAFLIDSMMLSCCFTRKLLYQKMGNASSSLEKYKQKAKNLISKDADQVSNRMDQLIGAYYRDCGVNDYYNASGIGRFARFAHDKNTQIEYELGTNMRPRDCKFIDFDPRFPFHSDVIDQMYSMNFRDYVKFYIMQHCYEYNAVPSTQKIAKALKGKIEARLASLECRCICGGLLTQIMDCSTLYDGTGVGCDKCGKSGDENEIFWHCEDESNSEHEYGYDICHYCAIDSMDSMPNAQPPDQKHKLSATNAKDVTEDESIRIKNVLHSYNGRNDIGNVDIHTILNDFLDLLQNSNNSREAFEWICNELKGVCDVEDCIIFKRHYRDRQREQTDDLYSASEDAFKYQMLDKMHCFCRHSFDIGYKVRGKDMESLNDHEMKHNTHLINTEMVHFVQTISNNRRSIISNNDIMKSRTNAKYNQMKLCQEETKTQPDDSEHDKSNAIFSFGTLFKYGDDDKNIGVHQKYICVSPKFGSLKEELTQNDICGLNMQQFTNEYKKSKVHLNSRYCRQNRAKQRITEWQYKGAFYSYGLYDYSWEGMSLRHLLSIMIYCNYDVVQHYLSKTYYSSEYIHKHNSYYHLGKNLKTCVNQFGMQINDALDKFYHGISQKVLFPQIFGDTLNSNVRIQCPLSTSSSLAVATIFADDNDGLIVEFGGNPWSKCKHFSTSWVSDYPNEKEHLFIQNASAFSELVINNIIEITGCEHRVILDSLATIEGISLATDDGAMEEYESAEQQQYLEALCVKIICHQLSHRLKTYEAFEALNHYGQQLVAVYFRNKKTFSLHCPVVKREYSWFWSLLFDTDHEWIKLDEMSALFPNLTSIDLHDVNISSATFDRIVSDIARINSDSKWKNIQFHLLKTSALSARSILQRYSSSLRERKTIVYIPKSMDDNTLFMRLNTNQEELVKIVMDGMGQHHVEHQLSNSITAVIDLMLCNKPEKLHSFKDETQRLLYEYCVDNKRITVFWKNVTSMNAMSPFRVFYHKEFEWIKMKEINTVFAALEGIWIFDIHLCALAMESIVQHLEDEMDDTQIHIITIYPNKESDLCALDAVSKYQMRFDAVHFCIAIFEADYEKEMPSLSDTYICIEHNKLKRMPRDNQQRIRWL
eukprot:480661_1